MLVSIIVITYNSSRFVLETLESAYRQTYQDIELIVSDDCSTDDTYYICKQWVNSHKERFVRFICTQTPHNGGICWNYNHALNFAHGEWIKYIAGDDILKDNSIERYTSNIKKNVFIYTCITEHINQEGEKLNQFCTKLPNKSATKQMHFMLRFLYIIEGSSLFFEKNHLISLNGFDLQYPMIEDWPITMKYLTNKLRVGIIKEPLLQWREYNESVSHTQSSSHLLCDQSYADAIKFYTLHYCWKYGLFFHQYYYWVKYWIDKHHSNYFYKTIGYFLRCFDFVYIYRKIMSIPDMYRTTLENIK